MKYPRLICPNSHPANYQQQHGVALITALLVVALVTATTVAMVQQQQFDIYRTRNTLNADQAVLYALGAEAWATRILKRDANNSDSDHLAEAWTTELPPLPIPGGTVQGQLFDLQGRFNLNQLVDEAGEVDPAALDILQRLLVALELSPTLAAIIADWIDADSEVLLPDGAEDEAYTGKQTAYRTGNTPLRHLSELQLLSGITPDIYQTLYPHVIVLPTATQINLNTTTAPLLMTIVDGLTASDAEQLISLIQGEPLEAVQDFLVQDLVAGLPIASEHLTISSRYFNLQAQAEIAGGRAYLTSLIYRGKERIEVLQRDYTPSSAYK